MLEIAAGFIETGYTILVSLALTFHLSQVAKKIIFSYHGSSAISKITGDGFIPDTHTAGHIFAIEVIITLVVGTVLHEPISKFIGSQFLLIGQFFILLSAAVLLYAFILDNESDSSEGTILLLKILSTILFILAITATNIINSHLELWNWKHIINFLPTGNSTLNTTNNTL